MDTIIRIIMNALDNLYLWVVSPLFDLLGRLLEFLLLRPMQYLHLPLFLQVCLVAVLTALLSLLIRKLAKVEEKEGNYRKEFLKQRKQHDDLALITDWKSREQFARSIDNEIDEGFNTYLAHRFSRMGFTYLIPLFLSLFWLDQVFSHNFVALVPDNSYGITGVSTQLVFLLSYCAVLVAYFWQRKNRLLKAI